MKIDILDQYELSPRQRKLSTAELDQLRRNKPLQAAVHLMHEGQTDEARKLVAEAHQRLKTVYEQKLTNQVEHLQDKFQTELEASRQDKISYQQEIQTLKQSIQALDSPPFSRAILCELLEASNQDGSQPVRGEGAPEPSTAGAKQEPTAVQRAVIAIGSGRHEVCVSPQAEIPASVPPMGLEAWTAGQAMTIVKFGGRRPNGTTAQVMSKYSGGRLRVKGRGGEEFLVQMVPEMAANEDVESGDVVLVVQEAELALELLEKANRKLTLDEAPTVSYDEIGGMDAEIAQIRKAIELPFIFRNVYRKYHLRRPKGILLYGPPGCGKTMVAKAIANSLYTHTERALRDLQAALKLFVGIEQGQDPGQLLDEARSAESDFPQGLEFLDVSSPEGLAPSLSQWLAEREIDAGEAEAELRRISNRLAEGADSYFLSIKGPELLSKWVGESEHNIRQIFVTARKKATQETPVILFFDEIESMFSRRGSGRSSDMEKTIVPQLLAEIDGVNSLPNVLLIGASNRYDLIDPAVLRPGRLDIKIRVDRPNREAATEILRKYLTEELPIDSVELQRVEGEQEAAIDSLIHRTTDVFYNPGSYILIYQRESRESRKKRFRQVTLEKNLSEVVSGAMLANVVERAKRSAAEREVRRQKAGLEYGKGVNWNDDLYPSIRQECEEGKDQYIFEARGGQGEMAYLDADLFEAEVVLKEESKGGRPIARWAKFKERPWL